MPSSRQTRIILLLILDSLFFLLEIIIGYSVHSLALVADSFHMLNDVMSLIVALYAVKLASQTNVSPKYSYGWQRAEVLGALINGVFLVALCFSIFMEAIERFFNPEDIQNPKLVLIVGIAGLLSNILGLVLFHEHSHSGHEHHTTPIEPTKDLEQQESPLDEIYVHPVQARQSVVLAARQTAQELEENEDEMVVGTTDTVDTNTASPTVTTTGDQQSTADATTSAKHSTDSKDHSHSHGGKNLNMRGVFLHVLGDALGNIGVIISALFIKYTSFSWRFYADPIVSIIITIIIFITALPLVKSASFILLQGVPSGVPLDIVKTKIKELSGIYSVHELHIWQLSDTKRIASVHILISPSADYVKIVSRIRNILHTYGVHSTTIQPEFVTYDANEGERTVVVANPGNPALTGEPELVANEIDEDETACFLRCAEDCAENSCCPVPPTQQRASPDQHF